MIILITGLGLLVGSFINAWVWRTRMSNRASDKQKQKYSIVNGRSMCPSCKHELSATDLVPVFSWIYLRGKCRYCKAVIGKQYPLVELATATMFGLSYVFWPEQLQGLQYVELALWLILLSALIALAIYDFKYMLLPNTMILVAAMPVLIGVVLNIARTSSIQPIFAAVYGLVAFGGLFYVLFQVSNGRWIGGGDVKLGFVLGAWLASPVLSIFAIFTASVLGLIATFAVSIATKVSLQTKVPFGPFLIAGTIVSFFFGDGFIDVYTSIVLGM